MKNKINWAAILSISAVGLCLMFCLAAGLTYRFAPNLYQAFLDASSLDVGDEAPDFELETLAGETVRLSDFKGSPILLSFGATWCPGCRLEAPLVEKIHRAHPELVVLLVDIKEDADVVQDFADEFDITHRILLDRTGLVSTQYQVFAIPTSLFIDAQGVIRAKTVESFSAESLAENLSLIGVQP